MPERAGTAVRVVRPAAGDLQGRQGLTYFVGVSAETVGSTGLCLHRLVVPPGGRAKAHLVWGTATEGVSKVSLGQRLNANQSRRSPHSRYTLLQQVDGNLVLRDSGGHVLWSSGTSAHPGAYTKVQHAGNVAAYLLVQDDGKVVLYSSTRQPLWSSTTG